MYIQGNKWNDSDIWGYVDLVSLFSLGRKVTYITTNMEDLVNFCDQRCQDGKNKCVGAKIPTKGYRRKNKYKRLPIA